MTYRGHVRNGQITLNESIRLPEGAEVNIEVVKNGEQQPTVWNELLKLAGTVDGLPPDMAENHDHYLYGTPKKK